MRIILYIIRKRTNIYDFQHLKRVGNTRKRRIMNINNMPKNTFLRQIFLIFNSYLLIQMFLA